MSKQNHRSLVVLECDLLRVFARLGQVETERDVLRAEVAKLRGFLEAVRPRPYTLNGKPKWTPGMLQVWKDIHEHLTGEVVP